MSTTHFNSFLSSNNQRTSDSSNSKNDEQQRKQIIWCKAIESANAQSTISNNSNNYNRMTINPLIKQRRRRRNEYSSTLQRARMIDTAVVVLV